MLVGLDDDLSVFWSFVRGTNASEVRDLSRPGLFVEPFWITLLSDLEGYISKHLDEGDRPIFALGDRMQITGNLAVGLEGGDK